MYSSVFCWFQDGSRSWSQCYFSDFHIGRALQVLSSFIHVSVCGVRVSARLHESLYGKLVRQAFSPLNLPSGSGFVDFWDTVLLCGPDWPQTIYPSSSQPCQTHAVRVPVSQLGLARGYIHSALPLGIFVVWCAPTGGLWTYIRACTVALYQSVSSLLMFI